MTLETFILCFSGIMNACWSILSEPIILGTYSLWNVFQGVFAVWAFHLVFIKGIFADIRVHKSNDKYYYDRSGKAHFKE